MDFLRFNTASDGAVAAWDAVGHSRDAWPRRTIDFGVPFAFLTASPSWPLKR